MGRRLDEFRLWGLPQRVRSGFAPSKDTVELILEPAFFLGTPDYPSEISRGNQDRELAPSPTSSHARFDADHVVAEPKFCLAAKIEFDSL